MAKQQRDQQAADAAVAIEKGVNRFGERAPLSPTPAYRSAGTFRALPCNAAHLAAVAVQMLRCPGEYLRSSSAIAETRPASSAHRVRLQGEFRASRAIADWTTESRCAVAAGPSSLLKGTRLFFNKSLVPLALNAR